MDFTSALKYYFFYGQASVVFLWSYDSSHTCVCDERFTCVYNRQKVSADVLTVALIITIDVLKFC